jgi:predicted transcriptional regulator
VGIITTTDIARAYSEGNLKATVEEYMKKNVITIREDEDILDAIKLMDLYGVGRLVVVSAVGEPVGIVTRTDVLRRLSAIGK